MMHLSCTMPYLGQNRKTHYDTVIWCVMSNNRENREKGTAIQIFNHILEDQQSTKLWKLEESSLNKFSFSNHILGQSFAMIMSTCRGHDIKLIRTIANCLWNSKRRLCTLCWCVQGFIHLNMFWFTLILL